MASAKKKYSKSMQDLPGLFDDVDSGFEAPDPRHRSAGTDNPDLAPRPIARPKSKLQFISFGSGSSGNSAYLGVDGKGGILIDAGVATETVIDELGKNGIKPGDLHGLLITHDHGDHTRYAYNLVRKLTKMRHGNIMPIFTTVRTLTGILTRQRVSRRIAEYHKAFYKEFPFECGPFMVTPFEVSHDGMDNVGFCISYLDHNFVVATDMGIITDRADHYMRLANFLMIESNYDAAMLAAGRRYSEQLKFRIRSEVGHLNNTVTAAYLAEIWGPHLTDIFLCHLSNENNRPDIALSVSRNALIQKGIAVGDGSGSLQSMAAQVQLSALPRYSSSPLYILPITI